MSWARRSAIKSRDWDVDDWPIETEAVGAAMPRCARLCALSFSGWPSWPASEIAMLKLDADWVILSACNTAAAARAGGEGLSGLARIAPPEPASQPEHRVGVRRSPRRNRLGRAQADAPRAQRSREPATSQAAHTPSRPSSRRRSRARRGADRKSAWRYAAASAAPSYPPPKSHRWVRAVVRPPVFSA